MVRFTREGSPLAREMVLDAYVQAFTAARGEAPPVIGRDQKAADALLAAFSGDVTKACAVVARAFADPWAADKATLAFIAANPARFIGAPANGLVQPPAPEGEACWQPSVPLNEVLQ